MLDLILSKKERFLITFIILNAEPGLEKVQEHCFSQLSTEIRNK